jgi:hypothetical protein
MAVMKKWRVTINRWDIFVIKDVEAETSEAAQEIAFEWAIDDFHMDHVDGGVNSVEVEEEEV